jgi:hypothetical protein
MGDLPSFDTNATSPKRASFTIPSQRLLSKEASRAELEVAIREVEDLILRYVQPD